MKVQREHQFGNKQRRFEAKIELQEYFNKDPGPGAYQNMVEIQDHKNKESESRVGILNGFVSKSDRF